MRRLLDAEDDVDLFISRIAMVELESALARRGRDGSLSEESAQAIREQFLGDCDAMLFFTLELTDGILDHAANIARRHAVRALDAIHLASVVVLDVRRKERGLSPTTLISADLRLVAVALTTGISAMNPNELPFP